MALIEGYFWGILLAVLVGPVFFTLIQCSLEKGFKFGFLVGLGIFFSDLLCVVLLYGLGATQFFENQQYQTLVAFLGAVLLIGLGLKYAFKPANKKAEEKDCSTKSYVQYFAKGFFINMLNPFLFVVWMGIIGVATTKYFSEWDRILFLAGVLLMIISSDTLKALFAFKLKALMRPDFLLVLYRLIGVGLIGFGLRLLFIVGISLV